MGKKSKSQVTIGLTGSIGAGKSTVAMIFAQLGIPIFDSDIQAKRLMQTDKALIGKIKSKFGSEVYNVQGDLNRTLLADLVFNDTQKLKELNQMVHPAVGQAFRSFCKENQDSPMVLKEAAILFESGGHKKMDRIICVVAPKEIRMNRVISRDNSDQTKFEARESKQWPEAQKAANAHYVLNNDGNHLLLPQVVGLYKALEVFHKERNS